MAIDVRPPFPTQAYHVTVSPPPTGGRNDRPSIATVTTRAFAVFEARMPLPKSICDINHPPKTSPLGFVSAGMAMVRITNSPLGFSGDRILSDHLITGHRKRSRGIPMSYL